MNNLLTILVLVFAFGCVATTSSQGTTPGHHNVNPDAHRVAAPM